MTTSLNILSIFSIFSLSQSTVKEALFPISVGDGLLRKRAFQRQPHSAAADSCFFVQDFGTL
jgi:hypothetical protein